MSADHSFCEGEAHHCDLRTPARDARDEVLPAERFTLDFIGRGVLRGPYRAVFAYYDQQERGDLDKVVLRAHVDVYL